MTKLCCALSCILHVTRSTPITRDKGLVTIKFETMLHRIVDWISFFSFTAKRLLFVNPCLRRSGTAQVSTQNSVLGFPRPVLALPEQFSGKKLSANLGPREREREFPALSEPEARAATIFSRLSRTAALAPSF